MVGTPVSNGRLLRAVFVLLAAVLLITGIFKLDGLREMPSGSAGWVLQALLASFELAFAGWLLVGLFPRWTRLAALALFLTFLNVALARALEGNASCGCLGRATVSPWWMVALDGTAVLLLAVSLPPVGHASGTPDRGSLRLRYVLAGLVVIVAIGIATGFGVYAAQHHSPYGGSTDLPKAQLELIGQIVQGIEQNQAGLHGVGFESRLTTKNSTVKEPVTERRKLKNGGEVVIQKSPLTEWTYRYTVTAEGVKRIGLIGPAVQESVVGKVWTELRPDAETVWLRPANADPRNTSNRLDPSTWGFYVPIARPTDWLAAVVTERVERLSHGGRELVRLEAHSVKGGSHIIVDFNPLNHWLPETLEQFEANGGWLIGRTEMTYQAVPGRSGLLPQTSVTWGWPSGKVRLADKEAAPYMFTHSVERVATSASSDAESTEITVPAGYRLLDTVSAPSVVDQVPEARPASDLSRSARTDRSARHNSLTWVIVAVNLVLAAGLLVARRKLAL